MTGPLIATIAGLTGVQREAKGRRADFPLLAASPALHYLDSAATSQKPAAVLDAMREYYERDNANPHRGAYALSVRATDRYHEARRTIARFAGLADTDCLIFTRGTTESLNLVATAWGGANVGAGDEIVVTAMEHHANFVPWQQLARAKGATFRIAPLTSDGRIDLRTLGTMLGARTRVFAFPHVSNALGTVNPVGDVVRAAHHRGIPVLVDGAQAAPHLAADIQSLGCDFFACSGHKLFGPTGIGVLYGRAELLDGMAPWQGGGDMIAAVSFERSTWAAVPAKFEAGTPNIAGAVGLGAAVDFLSALDHEAVRGYEAALLRYATERIAAVPDVRLVGTAPEKASIVSFVMDGVHPHDIATILDADNICIRAGHHCAQPLMARLGVAATARASFALYSTRAEVDALAAGLERVRQVMAR